MIYRYHAERGGWRFVVLYHKGWKWIEFVDVSTFKRFERPVNELQNLRPYDYSPRKLAAQMSKRRAQFKRLGAPFTKRAVQRAITALKAGAGS